MKVQYLKEVWDSGYLAEVKNAFLAIEVKVATILGFIIFPRYWPPFDLLQGVPGAYLSYCYTVCFYSP